MAAFASTDRVVDVAAGDRGLPSVGATVVAGFESTYLPAFGVDALDLTRHAERWRDDLDAVLCAGVRHLRYPLRWQRIEQRQGRHDWRETDAVLGYLHDRGAVPIVDLVHHTSYPDWLTDGFRDARFGAAYVRFAEAVAVRYPWLRAYTLFNEPFATLFLAGHEALWPPYDAGDAGFVRLLRSVLPGLSEAARCWRELLPDAAHVWVDTAEHHTGSGAAAAHAAVANDRRFVVLDLALGQGLDRGRPYLDALLAAGGEPLLELEPLQVDLLGLDYYAHSEWHYDAAGGHAPSPRPIGLARIIEQYHARYGLPMLLAETNLRGTPTDRLSWLRYTLEQYELAAARGAPLHGFCWFPQVDSCDWNSLLALCSRRPDPVGVVGLRADGGRASSTFTRAWEAVVGGARSSELPAYRFQSPCDRELAGFLPLMAHWPWQDPPIEERVAPTPVGPVDVRAVPRRDTQEEAPVGGPVADLIVVSHLRWTWVWQRPQHLVSRLARLRAEAGGATFFVEQPVATETSQVRLRTDDLDGITRVWLEVPAAGTDAAEPHFDDPCAADYGDLLATMFRERCRPASPDVWLYTPVGQDIADRLGARRLIYDVMDDLASFRGAPPSLVLAQRRLLARADVVFTGGRSLHRSVTAQRRHDVHLFPSGVETRHYARARTAAGERARPVAGYVGVIDERLDLDLVAGLAAGLPGWTVRLVGPVTKIDPELLPVAANLEYVGMVPYADLPDVMAGLDVALMPFALNEATRSISPTKTLEYLAAGLPVVSTRVPDVVADYGGVVHLADDGEQFAAACLELAGQDRAEHERRVRPILQRQEWDTIAASMAELLAEDGEAAPGDTPDDEATA